MRKLFVSLCIVAAALVFSCKKVDTVPPVEHHKMSTPENAQLASVQCDRPCAIFYDRATGIVVMQYFDGSTYKVYPYSQDD